MMGKYLDICSKMQLKNRDYSLEHDVVCKFQDKCVWYRVVFLSISMELLCSICRGFFFFKGWGHL